MKRCRLKRFNFQIIKDMSKKNKTSDEQQNGNDFIADVSGSLLIPISTLKDWIDRLDSTEWSLNHRIYVKDDIEELVKNAEKQ